MAQVKDKQKCEDAFEKYCRNLERTNMWGGQHELLAEREQSSRDHPKSTPEYPRVQSMWTRHWQGVARALRRDRIRRASLPCDMHATHA